MTITTTPPAELTRKAINVLSRELGPSDTARFINQFTNGLGDYTAERDAMFPETSLEQILSDVKVIAGGPPISP